MASLFGVPLAIALALVAPQSDPAGLAELVAEARTASPRILAARLEADAARERVGPAGSLPDPMLTFGIMNRAVSDPGRSDIQMTMNQIMISQRIPWRGQRSLMRAEVEALAAAREASAREVELGVVTRVRELYYEIAYLDRAAATLRVTRDLLRSFREVSESLYAVGDGVQADVLQAQIAVAEATGNLTLLEERRIAVAARLNALLGRGPREALPAPEMPSATRSLPSIEELMRRAAERRPALTAARERSRAAQSAKDGATLNTRPDIALSAAYGHRRDFADLASLSLAVSLPVFSGSKQQPRRREANSLLLQREAEELELLNETYASLVELRATAERALDLERLYATSILPQARAAVEAALSGYRVGRLDFMTLLSAQTTVNRFEIERLRLAADHHIAIAGIEAFLDIGLEELEQ